MKIIYAFAGFGLLSLLVSIFLGAFIHRGGRDPDDPLYRRDDE